MDLSCSWSLGKCFQFFTIEDNVCCRLITYRLYYVEVGSLYAHFLKSFKHKWVLNLAKSFSAYIEIIIWFLSSPLLIWCITLIDLNILKNHCIPGIHLTYYGVWAFLCVAEFCLLNFCWGFLHLCSSGILAYNFHFFVMFLSGFVSG